MLIFDEIMSSLKKIFKSTKRRKRLYPKKKKSVHKKDLKKKTVSKKKSTLKKKIVKNKKRPAKARTVKKRTKPVLKSGTKKKAAVKVKKKPSVVVTPKKKPLNGKKKIIKSPVKKKAPKKAVIKEKDKKKAVLVGEITHFFSKIQVVVLRVTNVSLLIGDKILIKYKTEKFIQKVSSLQVESNDVKVAKKGQLVGLKVVKPVKVGAQVFKI